MYRAQVNAPVFVGEGEGARRISKEIAVGEGDGSEKVEVLELNLLALTPNDIDLCLHEAQRAKGDLVRVLYTDTTFHFHLAARSLGVEATTLRKKLDGREYVEVAATVQSFLTRSA